MNCRNYVLRPLLAGLFLLVLASSADGATLNVPADYTTIQAAVNAAAAGDTILVQSGTYYENVNVNKQLTLQGVDSGSGLPVVDGGGSGNAITLSANNCILKDFVATSSGQFGIRVISSFNTITGNTATGNLYGIVLGSSIGNTISGNFVTGNTHTGIYLYLSNGNTISGNTVTGNTNYGIYLTTSSNGNTINGNTATSNSHGIYLSSTSNNVISSNTATGNTYYGIYLGSSSNNVISGNTVTGNGQMGIFLSSSSSNTINGNTVTSNTNYGIYISSSNGNTVSGNTANNNFYGIYLVFSSNNVISSNTATGNTYGIYLGSSSNNVISGNTVTGNGQMGILLSSSSGNTINGNTATGNLYSIYLSSSSSNTIYLNTFNSGWSNGANNWNSTTEIAYENATTYVGNNWSNYAGFDCDGDGIGDTAYPVAGGSDIDYHPIGGIPCLTCISGYKLDGCGEPLEGWTIFVDSDRNGALDSGEPANVTNADGYWQICDLEAGAEVRVAEQTKAGWRASQPSTGWQGITVQPDNATAYVNFTNIQLLCISGYKLDESGVPLADWNINLTNGSYTNSTLTDSSGKYEFCGLEPGEYDLSEALPAGWMAVSYPGTVELNCTNVTDQNFVNRKHFCINGSKTSNCTGEGLANWTIELRDEAGALIDSKETDSAGDYSFCNLEPGNYTVCELLQEGWKNVTPSCIPVTLDADSSENNNFLNDPPICISGRKINDCTEEGIAGWKIFLYDAVGNRISNAVTDRNGGYSFCNLTQGIYYVCEEEREGWIPVHESTGPSNSTSEPVTCNMPWCDDNCVCVNLGCDGAEVNFRNIPQSLCINGSKINNCTGAGIAGWGIYLYDATGKNIATTQTDRNGRYSFCGLAPGQYRVCEEERDGWIPVTDINHSSASCLPEDCTCEICNNCIPVILDCENSEGNDFENIPPTSIKGKVIDDCTGEGLENWEIHLYDSGGNLLDTRWTAWDGSYEFVSSKTVTGGLKLTAGSLYTVCETVQSGWTPVTYHANNTSRPMSNENCIPVFLDCGETVVEDFENIPPLCISGHEFNHCTGEGLAGWTMLLKDSSGNVIRTMTTDSTGSYRFCGLKPGWYTVCEKEIPEGWTSFRDDPGSPAMALPGTSGAPEDCERPKCIVVRLDYCEDSTDNDFENIPIFCINGTVYNNSTTVANFPVKIENSDASQILSIPTDQYGEYSFCGLKAGTYTVCVDKPGWTADKPCVIVYLDCMDEEQDFDVYMGRSNILPGIEQPAITLDDSSGAVVQGERSDGPSVPTEPDIGGDEEEGRQTSTPEIA